jgi:hypothetical protein
MAIPSESQLSVSGSPKKTQPISLDPIGMHLEVQQPVLRQIWVSLSPKEAQPISLDPVGMHLEAQQPILRKIWVLPDRDVLEESISRLPSTVQGCPDQDAQFAAPVSKPNPKAAKAGQTPRPPNPTQGHVERTP